MLDVVNIGKSQLGGVSGDALMRGIDNIFFGQQLVKSDTPKKIKKLSQILFSKVKIGQNSPNLFLFWGECVSTDLTMV
jgi:hypothetical protein